MTTHSDWDNHILWTLVRKFTVEENSIPSPPNYSHSHCCLKGGVCNYVSISTCNMSWKPWLFITCFKFDFTVLQFSCVSINFLDGKDFTFYLFLFFSTFYKTIATFVQMLSFFLFRRFQGTSCQVVGLLLKWYKWENVKNYSVFLMIWIFD